MVPGVKKKRAFLGSVLLASTPFWHFVGRVSEIDFLVGVGRAIGPGVMGFLSQWGWLASAPVGLIVLFFALRGKSPSQNELDTVPGTALANPTLHDSRRLEEYAADRMKEFDRLDREEKQAMARDIEELKRSYASLAPSAHPGGTGQTVEPHAGALAVTGSAQKVSISGGKSDAQPQRSPAAKILRSSLAHISEVTDRLGVTVNLVRERYNLAVNVIKEVDSLLADQTSMPEQKIEKAREAIVAYHRQASKIVEPAPQQPPHTEAPSSSESAS